MDLGPATAVDSVNQKPRFEAKQRVIFIESTRPLTPAMSALPPIAPECRQRRDRTLCGNRVLTRCSKKALLFHDLAGAGEQSIWHLEAECFGGFEIDEQLEPMIMSVVPGSEVEIAGLQL
jgi:hypothetical protein